MILVAMALNGWVLLVINHKNVLIGVFCRYDSGQCVSLQQPLGPPRVPPQGIYGYMEDSQEHR